MEGIKSKAYRSRVASFSFFLYLRLRGEGKCTRLRGNNEVSGEEGEG